jgi:transcriptional regulator with XRE-family HTH domain
MSETMHDKIARLMRERGMSARALSMAAGLNVTAVSHILLAQTSARMASVEAIARALDVDVSYLVSDVSKLTAEEADLIRALRSMDREQKTLVRSMAMQLATASRQKPEAPGDPQD